MRAQGIRIRGVRGGHPSCTDWPPRWALGTFRPVEKYMPGSLLPHIVPKRNSPCRGSSPTTAPKKQRSRHAFPHRRLHFYSSFLIPNIPNTSFRGPRAFHPHTVAPLFRIYPPRQPLPVDCAFHCGFIQRQEHLGTSSIQRHRTPDGRAANFLSCAAAAPVKGQHPIRRKGQHSL